jgi:membrane dipeptidase
MNTDSAVRLQAESIVIDGVCPLIADDPAFIEWYQQGGVTALAPTVGGTESARTTLDRLARWQRLLAERADLMLVRQAEHVEIAKQSRRLGIYFHLQGVDPIEDNLDLIDLYKALGVGIIQLTYNVKNRVGDGCEERTDAGLSHFGVKLVERMNKRRVIVDCSHTGLRTSMDAVQCSDGPVVLSHSNVASVHASARNVPNSLIKAIADSGGLIGIAGFPAMVAAVAKPSLDHFIAHIDAVVQSVGVDHVALGLDYYPGQAGIATDEVAMRGYNEAVASGLWSAAYPPPPHHYPAGIETPRTLLSLTRALMERGYGNLDVRKILGENWLRVMRSVWG